MAPAYIAGVTEHLPQAQIIFDRFHLSALLGKAMDELRKSERRESAMLKGHKYTVRYRYEKLTAKNKTNKTTC